MTRFIIFGLVILVFVNAILGSVMFWQWMGLK